MEEFKNKQMDILRDVGLTEGETRVYLLLLNSGPQKATKLSKETGLNRSNLYRILESLNEKKLIFSSTLKSL